jgi:superfamily II DNA or RNA helicase
MNCLSLSQKKEINSYLTICKKENAYFVKEKREQFSIYRVDESHVYLPYTFAKKYALKNNIRVCENRDIEEINSSFTGMFYPHQVPVVKDLMKDLHKNNTSCLALPPGFGKTIIGTGISVYLGLKTVILIDRKILISQWKKSIKDNSDMRIWIVGEGKRPNSFDIAICMNKRVELLSDIRREIGLIIVDEAHQFCTSGHIESLTYFEPRYIIFQTATPEREDGLDVIIKLFVGYKKFLYIGPPSFNVIPIFTDIQGDMEKGNKGIDWSKLTKSLYYNEERNNTIVSLVKSLLCKSDTKIIIMTNEIEHVKLLVSLIKKIEPRTDSLYGKKDSYNSGKVLVGNISKCGTGFDEANYCKNFDGQRSNTLILCRSIKKTSLLYQVIGRLRDSSGTIYYIVDNNRIMKNHWRISKKWLSDHGSKIKS